MDLISDPAGYERTFVHDVYQNIASHFSDTRYRAWPQVKTFVEGIPRAHTLLDIGCGNGKNLPSGRRGAVGCDYCSELVALSARDVTHEVCVADALRLPFRAGAFQAGICIAVLHHISTVERRVGLLREAARVLCSGAPLLCYAWAHEQDKHKHDTQDVLIPWKKRQRESDEKAEDRMRYCHLFKGGELEALVTTHCGDVLVVTRAYYDKENWCMVCTRK